MTKDLDDIYLVGGFKHLTADNWTQPDDARGAFVELDPATGECREPTAERWAQQFLTVELSPRVPDKIRDMWAIARGTLLYAWFFYPLYALGERTPRFYCAMKRQAGRELGQATGRI